MSLSVDGVLDAAVMATEEATRDAIHTADDALADAILELAALPKLDYERLRRAKADALGIRVTQLDAAVRAARQAAGDEQTRTSQRDELLAIALGSGELWRDEGDEAFATIQVGAHREHFRVRSTPYRRWVVRSYGDHHKIRGPNGEIAGAPGSQALTEALVAIEANAARGPLEFPKLRLAGSVRSAVYLDLGDATWRAVEIDAQGWRIVADPPARFVRAPGMLPLPEPRCGDGLVLLRRFLAIDDDTSFRLTLGWLIGGFRPSGPYPVLAIHGEQGSGKSTLVRMLRRLIDPNRAGDRSRPRDERDLVIAATNSWLVCFDNLSRLDEELSDGMCRIATGAGFGTRTLYSDDAETLFQVCRPQLVNGIPDLARSGDLIDRCVQLELPPREASKNAYEDDLWPQFESALPEMLGALLDAVSCAIRRLDQVQLARRPRLVDFARWVEAAAPALGWGHGVFVNDYLSNRDAASRQAIEADAVAGALKHTIGLLESKRFKGTATELLALLNRHATDDEKRAVGWPKNAAKLGDRLRRAAPALRRDGLKVMTDRQGHARSIELEEVVQQPSLPSQPSRPSLFPAPPDDGNDGSDGNDGRFTTRTRYDEDGYTQLAPVMEGEL